MPKPNKLGELLRIARRLRLAALTDEFAMLRRLGLAALAATPCGVRYGLHLGPPPGHSISLGLLLIETPNFI
jgi:hypothetical protein